MSGDSNNPILENQLALAAMAEALAKSADYRVLRRLVPRETFNPSIGQSTKTGILLDVETTGLDQQKDQIIEPLKHYSLLSPSTLNRASRPLSGVGSFTKP